VEEILLGLLALLLVVIAVAGPTFAIVYLFVVSAGVRHFSRRVQPYCYSGWLGCGRSRFRDAGTSVAHVGDAV
jgi:hypothetical protein